MKVIMVRTALDEIRKNSNHNAQFSLLNEQEWEIQNNKPNNWENFETDLDLEEYWDLFKALQEPEKTIFNLFAIDGFSHREIAEQLSISERTSKRYLNKARTTLSEQLQMRRRIEKGA